MSNALALRLQAASDSGAIEAAIGTLMAHPIANDVCMLCGQLIAAVCSGTDGGGGGGGGAGGGVNAAAFFGTGSGSGVASRRARAANAGAIEALIEVLQRAGASGEYHPVYQAASSGLGAICAGSELDEEALVYRGRASDAGGLEALCSCLLGAPKEAGLQEHGCKAITHICLGGDALARARKQRACDAGAIEVTAAACGGFAENSAAVREGTRALVTVIAGIDTLGKARQQRAHEIGALKVIVGSLTRAGGASNAEKLKAARYRALRNLTRNNEALIEAAKEMGARPEWL